MQKLRRSGLSIAYHKAGTAFAAAAGLVLVSVSAVPAYAFKIFGMSFFEGEPEPEVVDPVRYDVTLNTPGADDDLAETLQNSSQLYQDREKPVSGNLGLAIKARDDRDRILAALYENARYGGLVDIRIAGRALDDLPPDPHFATGQPVPVTVTVTPGPAFTLRSIRFTGDASGRNPADYQLNPGEEAKSTVILRAGEKMVADLKSEGRPFAKLTARNAVADHATSTVDVEIGAQGGPVATLGSVAVTGTKTIDPDFVADYSRLNGGQPYSPERLQKASDRLRQLSVFSSVTIREANQLQPDGSLPLTIEVSEGKHRYFGAGAQVSTTEGVGLQGYWGHRNLFGRAESLRIEGSVDRIGESKDATKLDYSAGIAFAKPGAFGPASTFTASVKAALLDPDAYKATTFTGAVGVSFELSEQDTISGGAELAYADVEDPFGKNKYLTASIPLDYVRDTRDNKLNPTTGYRATLSAKPSYETRNGTLFSSFEASGTAYKGFGSENRFVLAGKLAAGSIVGGGDLSNIPATRRYYLGGGGTVRGYSYQEISPRNAQNELLGGRSFVQGSVEMRVGITEKISVVPFIDAATVSADSTPDFKDIRAGAGIGLRYATPFGPIRLDVAMPLKKYDGGTSYGIYAGIGQAF